MEEPLRKTLRDALPGAQVKVFDGLGHNPFWEDPAGVAPVINSFLSINAIPASVASQRNGSFGT